MRKSSKNSLIDTSVVIVNYNTGKLLSECIASIKQSANVEIIVVDNASTKELKIKNLKLKTTTQNFKLILNKENIGFARAVNQGIREANGAYILLLNPDTKVKQGAIDRMVAFAKSRPDAGVVGARLVNPDGTVQPSVFHFPTFRTAVKEFWLGQKDAYLKYIPAGDEPMEVDSVVGAAFLITPQGLKKVGLLDERFWMYFEDLDYCRRVRQVGLKVYYLPQAEVIHYHGISGHGQEEVQMQRLTQSSKIYHGIFKHFLVNFIILVGQKCRRIFS